MEYDNLLADRSSAMNVNVILNYTMADEDAIYRSIKIIAEVIGRAA